MINTKRQDITSVDVSEEVQIVSDEEVSAAWGNANFGVNCDKRNILSDTMLKYASGYSSGYTAMCICKELGLLGKNCDLTKKGKQYLYWSVHAKYERLKSPIQNIPIDIEDLQKQADKLQVQLNATVEVVDAVMAKVAVLLNEKA